MPAVVRKDLQENVAKEDKIRVHQTLVTQEVPVDEYYHQLWSISNACVHLYMKEDYVNLNVVTYVTVIHVAMVVLVAKVQMVAVSSVCVVLVIVAINVNSWQTPADRILA